MFDKKIWSFFSIILIAAMLLAACSPSIPVVEKPTEKAIAKESPVAEATEEPSPSLAGTITLWHSLKESEIEGLSSSIVAFQKQYPFVVFDVLFVPFDDLRGKFETSIANGGGPTLLIGAADWGPSLYNAELVADIAPLAKSSFLQGINQAALGSLRYKDALIGLPIGLKGVVLYRNNSIITEAPATAADLIAAAQAATAGHIVGANLERGFFFSAGHLYGVGGQLMDENGNAQFNDEKGAEWLNLLISFSDAGPTEYYTDNDVNLFKQGAAGMIIDVSWNLNDIAGAIGEENLSIDPWPVGMSGFVQNDNIYMGFNTEGEDKAATWTFMEYLLTPEIQADLAENNAEFIPAALGAEVTDRLRQEVVAAFEDGVTYPVIPEMGAYWEPMDTALKSVFNEGAAPVTALQRAFDAVVAAIAGIRSRN